MSEQPGIFADEAKYLKKYAIFYVVGFFIYSTKTQPSF